MANTWDFNKKFGCQILLHRGKSHESGAESHYFVKGLSFDLFTKYRWYFRYRAALLQVQYPMRYVELRQFDYEHKPEKAELRKRLKRQD